MISIPAPVRGRTSTCGKSCPRVTYFNSRPREGANSVPELEDTRGDDFNSRPREGANGHFLLANHLPMLFQFPPP